MFGSVLCHYVKYECIMGIKTDKQMFVHKRLYKFDFFYIHTVIINMNVHEKL